jgi:hypothetical protein
MDVVGVKGTAMKTICSSLKARFVGFTQKEDGAVTVDWVVLTAAVCGLAIIIVNVLQPALFDDGGSAIAAYVSEAAQR